MKVGMKLATVYVAAAILVAGCGQSNSGSAGTSPSQPAAAAQSQPSQNSPQKTSVNSVDGYKSFKFGMKPSELIKLAECPSSQADTYEKTKEKINEIGTNIVKIDGMLKEVQLARNELDHSVPINSWEEQQKLEGIKEISARENKLKIEREDIVRSLHGAFSAGQYMSTDEIMAMDKEAYYKIFLRCTVGFAGEEKEIDFTFNDQKQLKSLGITIGKFNQQKLDSLIEELRGKYPLSSRPTDVAIATYNNEKYGYVSWFFADNSIELKTIKDQVFGGVPVIVLGYHDAASAKEVFNASQKGKVSSGDL